MNLFLLPSTYPYRTLREDNPNVSFPLNPTSEDLAPFGVVLVHPAEPPTCNPATHRLEEAMPIEIDGVWSQQWTIIELTTEEQATYAATNPTQPDWAAFKQAMLTSPTINAALIAAGQSAPLAVLSLPPALLAAADGRPDDFRACWLLLRRQNLIPTEVLTEVAAAATAANLPDDLVGVLS